MTNDEIDEAVAREVMGWTRTFTGTVWCIPGGSVIADSDWSPTTSNADAFQILADGGLDYSLSYTDRLHRLGVYYGVDENYMEFAHTDLRRAIACGTLFAIRAAITLEEFADV